ncbi:saccharopine dehydrogenase [Gordonia sp. JH63]|uniref:saccharopine dehydrogenase n=1 Tax=Gordonia TaxID=2053 RepID=UPI0013200037|nr:MULTISPECIES: saccharopine dehydrogenase [unclassified Gordonia (in: high G+C Gram-positive bacteria)]MBN0974889.1 saccharopine dehydrogenase [Gordonia sp. BP-119]MBN0984966.1 saccharopine dehydrogenase [Gordonia sp. BP-94]QHD83990.1 saccharopine dehydrogenase [Gordonia sp. JH63]
MNESNEHANPRVLLLGGRGAVGTVVARELEQDGHVVTVTSRTASGDARIDLRGDLATLRDLAAEHDVVVNASGIERPELGAATGQTPLVDISASGAYLDRLRATATGPVVLGAGLAPGLSTILTAALDSRPDDDLDVLVMLGAGEKHGPAAVAWTVGLVGTNVHRPPENRPVRNLRDSRQATGPDGRTRRYLRADFPDHVLLGDRPGVVRSYLTLSSGPMTAALGLVGRIPALRSTLTWAPALGSDGWHVLAENRRTGERRHASGAGQSEATGRLTALAASRAAAQLRSSTRTVTMADLVAADEALAVLS